MLNSRTRIAAIVMAAGITASTSCVSGSRPGRANAVRTDAVSAPHGILPLEPSPFGEVWRAQAGNHPYRAIQPSEPPVQSRPTYRTDVLSKTDGCDQACRDDIARARAATERFWDVGVALAAGYVELGTPAKTVSALPGCSSTARGTEGIEYLNPGSAFDESIDVERPESLLYVPQGFGTGRRLVAVQYSVPVGGELPTPPELFGHPFEGPSPSRLPGIEVFRLRVWLFSDNPDELFASANPTEACDAPSIIAPHGTLEDCFEVNTGTFAPVDRVREVGRIPKEFRLEGERLGDEPLEGGGMTRLFIGAFHCGRVILEDGVVVQNLVFSEVTAPLQAPDWEGVGRNDWPIRFFINDRAVAESWRKRMGIQRGVIVYSPDVDLAVSDIVGAARELTFSSPEFETVGHVTSTVPAGPPIFPRFWREGASGVGTFEFWIDEVDFGAARADFIPKPGGVLAELVGCETNADSCDPISGGLAVTFEVASYRTDVKTDLWNPRNDTS